MSATFADLGLSEPIVKALADRGIESPFPIQEMSIPDAITGRDVCGKAKTGSGKTFAFGLPVLHQLGVADKKRPLALALVPTRELAVQVHDELDPIAETLDRTVCAIYGGADIEKQIRKINKGVDFVVATPGRLIDLIERKEISLDAIEHVMTVDSMAHRFLLVHQMDRPKVVAAIVNASHRTLVFSQTKHGCDRLVSSVNDLGVRAAAIHGDLRQKSRERALGDFASGELDVLVATDVAARGIHVDDVDMVIHYQPASDHKAYLHRSGRTARAGNSGCAVTLSLWNEELEVKRLLKRLGLKQPIVEMFSNDERLQDLPGWDPNE